MKTPETSRDREHRRIASTRSGLPKLLTAGIGICRGILLLMAVSTAGGLHAQTLTSLASAPTPGPADISQLSTSGNTTWPDGLNYFNDNDPPAGQTFTTGSNAMNLVSLGIKTAGLNADNGDGTPASTPTYYLRIYSINGGSQPES